MKRQQLLKIKMPKVLLSISVVAIVSSLNCSVQVQAGNSTCYDDCLNGGTCENGTVEFSCACAQGFTGNRCEININDCTGHSRCLNGGTCMDGTNSFTCACAEAFLGQNCEHHNECVYPETCASVGRDAKCKCREGYAQDLNDSRRCEPVNKSLNENATLIFGGDFGIDQLSLSEQTASMQVNRIQNSSYMGHALDVMYSTNTVFWNEGEDIYMAPIRQGAAKTIVLNDVGYGILSLAVDWIYNHLYYSNDSTDTISVANLDGSMQKVLISTQVPYTWAIVVDPLSGWMYWAERDAEKIERAAMDGSQREVIANTEPKKPHGLALDMTQSRLYWTIIDYPSSIHSMNVDGSDKILVFQAKPSTYHYSWFYSITAFGDFVYWKVNQETGFYRTNKCGGGKATEIEVDVSDWSSLSSFQAYHFSKQPEGVNYCENQKTGSVDSALISASGFRLRGISPLRLHALAQMDARFLWTSARARRPRVLS